MNQTMSMTLSQKVELFLRENPGKRFTAKEIANSLIDTYPEDFERKKKNSSYNDSKLLNQVASEIGAHKKDLVKLSIGWDDFDKPRRYFYIENTDINNVQSDKCEINESNSDNFKEKELYPLLIKYLNEELGLSCMRIKEGASKNSMGAGANKWLHPDIVGMQMLDKDFTKDVKELLQMSGSANVRLWSFEVKKEIRFSNLRESFFQAVSNSSWANEGYLVATHFMQNVESDLRILSALHGIGLIRLNKDDPLDSEIILPSLRRENVDWQSINRIAEENKDFTNFIKKVLKYIKTGEDRDLPVWNQ